jgi:hypothetical protein
MAKEYNITKTSGRCVACQREMTPGEEFVATIRETAPAASRAADAAPPKPAAKAAAKSAAKAGGKSAKAAAAAAPEEPEDQFAREDYCAACWAKADEQTRTSPSLFGVWHSRVPEPREKRRTFVDDELLVNFFERLEGAEEPAKVQFRFVLALILMRKRVLVYDRMDRLGDGQEVWAMHLKGSESHCQVVDPHLEEDRIAEVSQQLGSILEGEL